MKTNNTNSLPSHLDLNRLGLQTPIYYYELYPGGEMVLAWPTSSAYAIGKGQAIDYGPDRTVFVSEAAGTHLIRHGVLETYWRHGGPLGDLGFPLSEEMAANEGCYCDFQNGRICWTPERGGLIIRQPLARKYADLGGPEGFLGYPTGNDGPGARGGRYVNFEHGGGINWSAATGAHETHGAIRQQWKSLKYEWGPLGYPTTDEYVDARALNRNDFENGTISWDAATDRCHTTIFARPILVLNSSRHELVVRKTGLPLLRRRTVIELARSK